VIVTHKALRILLTAATLLVATSCAQVRKLFTPSPTALPSVRPTLPERPDRREPAAPPLLSPQVATDQEERLIEEAYKRIEVAERNLQSIDTQRLAGEQEETYQTISTFVSQARAALTLKDLPRALNLAQKAHILSDELSRALR
jgi:hypothetical protein